MITDAELNSLVSQALGRPVRALQHQTLAQSGNVVARAEMVDGTVVAVRVSAKRRVFDYTRPNLDMLRRAGLPVPKVLARGLTPFGGAYVILEWMRGRDLIYALPTMQPQQMVQCAQQVFEAQQRVGQMPPGDSFGWAPLGGSGGLAKWSDVFGPADASAPPNSPKNAQEARAAQLLQLRLSLEPYFESIRPVCFLDDLTIKNVLVDNGELTGLIDIDVVCYGDPLLVLGTTLAHIDTLVGERGRRYAEALLRCWAPQGERRRATGFYASLWVIAFLSAAIEQGNAVSEHFLTPVLDQLLRVAERV